MNKYPCFYVGWHTLCPKIASFGRMQNSLGHHCIIGMAGCLSYVSLVLAITILSVFQPFFISCNCLLIPNSRLYSDLYVLLSPSFEVKPIDVLCCFRVCLNDLLSLSFVYKDSLLLSSRMASSCFCWSVSGSFWVAFWVAFGSLWMVALWGYSNLKVVHMPEAS